jgi:hypothetical protein
MFCATFNTYTLNMDVGFSSERLVPPTRITVVFLCYSKDRDQPTITPKKGVRLDHRSAMSHMDCVEINGLYGCLNKSLLHRGKYYTLCRVMGHYSLTGLAFETPRSFK